MEPATIPSDQRIPLWLDCDPGHDDAFAILLASSHPQLELLGISTVHGNASLSQTTRNAQSILTAIGRDDVPVFSGTSKPFFRSAVHAPDIHGMTGLDGTELLPEPKARMVSEGNAVLAMREAVLGRREGTVWIVATGALTNVALLFATFPELSKMVKGLSIMGGAIGGGFTDVVMKADEKDRVGNETKWAEFNIFCDPEAAESLFSNEILAWKTTLIPLDLTHQVIAGSEVQNMVLHGRQDSLSGSATQLERDLRPLFHDILMFFASTYANIFGLTDGPPLHDPVAVAALLPGSIVAFDDRGGERWKVQVVTDGTHDSDRTRCGELGRVKAVLAEQDGVRIPRKIDLQQFWGLIESALLETERRLKQQSSTT